MLKMLKETQEELDKKRNELADKQKHFNDENKHLFDEIDNLTSIILGVKNELKQQAISEYQKDGMKKRDGDIGIRVMTDLQYDEDKAFEWAKEHSLCLSLNKKDFEKIAKTQDIEFVEKKEIPTVTFPKQIKLQGDE